MLYMTWLNLHLNKKLSRLQFRKEFNYFFLFFCRRPWWIEPRTTDTQRHKSKKSENLGRCGRQNMLWMYLKIWDWDWIFGCAVKAISLLGVLSPYIEQKSKGVKLGSHKHIFHTNTFWIAWNLDWTACGFRQSFDLFIRCRINSFT